MQDEKLETIASIASQALEGDEGEHAALERIRDVAVGESGTPHARNLRAFLTAMGEAVLTCVDEDADDVTANALRDYGNQLGIVGEAIRDDGTINWEEIDGQVGVDLPVTFVGR